MASINIYDRQQASNRIAERARDLGLEDDLDKTGIAMNKAGFSECLNPTVQVIMPWQKIEPCPGAVGLSLKTLLNNKSIEKAEAMIKQVEKEIKDYHKTSFKHTPYT